jgi:hypothetical protein
MMSAEIATEGDLASQHDRERYDFTEAKRRCSLHASKSRGLECKRWHVK